MNPGLKYLIARIPVVIGRRLRRQVRGVRAVLLLLILVVIVGPQVFQAVHGGGPTGASIASIRLWAPVVLVLMVLVSLSSGTAFVFRPQEVDFLFPAPVPRRELLLYRVVTTLAGGLLGALWITVFMFRHAPHVGFGIVGLVLAMWFLQMVSLLAGVAAAAADVRMTSWLRVGLWSVVGLAAGVGLAVVRWLMPGDAGLQDALGGLVRSLPVRVLTFPGRVYVEAYLAADLPQFLAWSGLGLAQLLLLFLALVRLDVAWTEGSVRQSQLILQRMRRASSEGMVGASGTRITGLRLPMLPRWLGVGPLWWRQLTEALRNLRSVLTTLVTFVGIPAAIMVFMGRDGESARMPTVLPFLIITVLSPHLFAFDFRRDLDRMAMLKALPLRPFAVAAGQVAVPTLLRTLTQALVLAVVAWSGRDLPLRWVLAVAVFLVPLNWMAGALDNALFLLWPHRIVQKSGEPMLGHRAMFGSLLKMVILGPSLGLCAGLGWLAMSLTGVPLVAGVVVSGVCTLLAILFTWWLARCFVRYDVAALAGD